MLAKAHDMLGLPVNDLLTIHEDLNKFNRVFRGLTALAMLAYLSSLLSLKRGLLCVCDTSIFVHKIIT